MVGPANLQPFARSTVQEEKKSKKKKKEDKEMLVNIGDTIEIYWEDTVGYQNFWGEEGVTRIGI